MLNRRLQKAGGFFCALNKRKQSAQTAFFWLENGMLYVFYLLIQQITEWRDNARRYQAATLR